MRDWGYAGEYVEGMWRMLQAATPDVFTFATGHAQSVREFVTMAFKAAGIAVAWHGRGEDERAVCQATNREIVRISREFYRPAEVKSLIGDFSKAERVLHWRPKINVAELCTMMVDADIERLRGGRHANGTVNLSSKE